MANLEHPFDPNVPIASLNGIHLVDGDTEVLKGVSFNIYPGELTLVSGPSGSGKSSSFRVLTAIEDPKLIKEGSITLFGHTFTPEQVRDHKEMPLGRLAIGLQTPNLDPGMTVLENLVTFHQALGTNGVNPYRRAHQTAITYGFEDHLKRVVENLSGGEQARVALGRVMMAQPDVLLLDEPTDAIDPVGTERMFGLLRAVTRVSGTAIAMTSHDLDAARPHVDREIVVNSGKITGEYRSVASELARTPVALAS